MVILWLESNLLLSFCIMFNVQFGICLQIMGTESKSTVCLAFPFLSVMSFVNFEAIWFNLKFCFITVFIAWIKHVFWKCF